MAIFIVLTGLSAAMPAHAQITQSARITLTPADTSLEIGRNIYVTPDYNKSLTYKAIMNRHQNNSKGRRSTGNIIDLGTGEAPVWMVFSALNNTSQDNWLLDFGNIFNGRMAQAEKLLVHNHTTGRTFFRALEDEERIAEAGKTGHMGGVEMTLKQNTDNIIVVYLEPGGVMPATIVPKLVRPSVQLAAQSGPVSFYNIMSTFLWLMAGFFLAIAYMRRNPSMLLYAAFYTLLFGILWALNRDFLFFSFTQNLISIFYGGAILVSLVLTRLFLNLSMNEKSESNLLLVLVGLVALATFNDMFGLLSTPENNFAILFGVGSVSMALIAFISFSQAQLGKFAGHHFALAWLLPALGSMITTMAAIGLISPSFILLNAVWLSLFPQAALFITGQMQQFMLIETGEKLRNEKENRVAQSLAEQKKTQETAEQDRLMRVIERERELMAELREREIQRTEEMRLSKDAADEANNAKSAFLAVISHEIRTPMTGIMGMVRLLLDTQMNNKQKEYMQAVQQSGDSMMALLNDVLDFEKIESGGLELEMVDFDLPRVVQGVVTLMSAHAAEKGLYLETNIDESTPKYVIGDPTRLRQVLLNLVNNALKFTQDGGVTINVKGTKLVDQPNGIKGDYEIYFGVQDTGIGISESAQQKLFTPFAQADSSVTRKFGGTGLGLTICKRIIDAMGSTIAINSQVDQGTTFHFSLLMEIGTEENTTNDSTALQEPSKNALEVLVIEDNEMNRRVLEGFLSGMGHKSTLVESGEDALPLIEKQKFDIILTDINLTGMNGLEVAQSIRNFADQNLSATPIIALTGNVTNDDIDKIYAANINGFLPKPIDADKLAATLQNASNGIFENPTSINNTSNQNEAKQADLQSHNELDQDSFEASIETFPLELEGAAVETEHTDDEHYLDIIMLKGLLDNLGKDQFTGLIDGFLSKSDELIISINAAKEEDDSAGLGERAHELKGMSANFGMSILSEIADEIERAAKTGKIDEASEHSKKIEATFAASKIALNTWLAKNS